MKLNLIFKLKVIKMNIKIENFEGPFDLLLHLIKKNKMDIYNVNIYDITVKYIDYINKLKEMDLDIASEFIVIAATLIEIKSRSLLPKKLKVEEQEEEEDLQKILFDRLVEYRKFKKVFEYLLSKYVSKGNVYFKKPEIIFQKKDSLLDLNEIFKDMDILDFYVKYKALINAYVEKQNISNPIQNNIYVDKFKIQDKIEYLKQTKESILKFDEIIENCEEKIEIIVTFIAVLELVKQKYFKVIQVDRFTNIIIQKIQETGEDILDE